MVAEELGKIVSAQQIFVLRKAIYRLTAHSTNPHAVLCAHLPLRSARGALRQRPQSYRDGQPEPVAICTRCAETKLPGWEQSRGASVAICTRCAETKVDPVRVALAALVAICTRCAETKYDRATGEVWTVVAICTRCAETKIPLPPLWTS